MIAIAVAASLVLKVNIVVSLKSKKSGRREGRAAGCERRCFHVSCAIAEEPAFTTPNQNGRGWRHAEIARPHEVHARNAFPHFANDPHPKRTLNKERKHGHAGPG